MNTQDIEIRSAIMGVITEVWDRAKQIDDAADEVLHLIEADRKRRGEPVAWISTVSCIGPDYGKERYGKMPIQSLQPGYYRHTPLYTAPPAAPDVRCEGCGYMTHHREHMGCVRAAKQNQTDVSGLAEVAASALDEIEAIMQEAYNSAYPVCCGRPDIKREAS